MPSERRLVTIAAAAEQLGVCTRTIHRYVSEGRLRAYRVGPRAVRFDPFDVAQLARPIPTARRARAA